MSITAFKPLCNGVNLVPTVKVAATAAAQSATLPGTGPDVTQLRIYNAASVAAYLNFGPSSLTPATVATGLPIAPNAVEIITIEPNASTVSVILEAGGSGNVSFSAGYGL